MKRFSITAEDIIGIINKVEDVDDYNKRMAIITEILTQFYNSQYAAEDYWEEVEKYENNRDKTCY